jgi:hypothetical protein
VRDNGTVQDPYRLLPRYCELDTMAMVMIYEGWKDWIK